jgi:glycosylphosphatidylinositol transamidase
LFKRNVYWAKDIILLVTDQGKTGTQAWLDAYHGMEDGGEFEHSLYDIYKQERIKPYLLYEDEFSAIVMPRSGTIQGAVNLDFPGTQDYETLGIFFGILKNAKL